MRTLTVVGVAVLSACGGAVSSPGVDTSKRLVALSTSEQQSLCDWQVQREGGYGHSVSCEASGAPLESPHDQAACVADFSLQASRFPNCPTTVGQWEGCATWFLANWCSAMPTPRPAECDAFQAQCF